mmetsp:Transcript_9670/g.17656  ORF Transcript_9670/g.17656 Transcript_9670/m.17656 type:complete len:376 (+) Transcript_9670:34-1161(+)|eukprot:CAMPEP_0197534072 /NCGR_PEP_ID=MMETSP1318-20131121/45853_1 /TAXON_ID=552666 /ORGANISM="Partenskyella glossopodia, Strain RCC365" /LENGTH=375 /DNA_ID=CAMNT_0043091197 /DNA_START=34 /DNA_END=1161 /DNA_ORIENTATION=+
MLLVWTTLVFQLAMGGPTLQMQRQRAVATPAHHSPLSFSHKTASVSSPRGAFFSGSRLQRGQMTSKNVGTIPHRSPPLFTPQLPSHNRADAMAVASTAAATAAAPPAKNGLIAKIKAFRSKNREFLSEFIGTFTLMFLGTAVNTAAALGQTNLVGVSIGWMFTIAMAVYIAGGVSEAHLNPAVTFALAVTRGFPWKKVLPYVVAQFLGAFAGSGLSFLDHKSGLDAMDKLNKVSRAVSGKGATAGIYATYPASHVSPLHAFGDEVLTTAALVMCVFAIGDQTNMSPKGNVGPVIVGGLVALLILGFGGITGVAMNPARDLAPRFMTYLAGWGKEVFTAGNNYWWIPIVAPLIGAPLGGLVYDFFIDTTPEKEEAQ